MSGRNGVDVNRLVSEIDKACLHRRGKPGEFQRELIEAMVPVVMKWKSKYGTKDQQAGQLLSIASEVSTLFYSANAEDNHE
jgi:hypothetical protein